MKKRLAVGLSLTGVVAIALCGFFVCRSSRHNLTESELLNNLKEMEQGYVEINFDMALTSKDGRMMRIDYGATLNFNNNVAHKIADFALSTDTTDNRSIHNETYTDYNNNIVYSSETNDADWKRINLTEDATAALCDFFSAKHLSSDYVLKKSIGSYQLTSVYNFPADSEIFGNVALYPTSDAGIPFNVEIKFTKSGAPTSVKFSPSKEMEDYYTKEDIAIKEMNFTIDFLSPSETPYIPVEVSDSARIQ